MTSADGLDWIKLCVRGRIQALTDVWIDIEIDDFDAAWRMGVGFAGMPRPIAELDVADLVEPEATPLASAGKARTGFEQTCR